MVQDLLGAALGQEYQIGHSYFMGEIDLEFIKQYKILPLLEEYFYGRTEELEQLRQKLNI